MTTRCRPKRIQGQTDQLAGRHAQTAGSLERICRHSLTRRIANRACAYDFRCEKCDFDQYFEDVLAAKTKSDPPWMETIKGFDVPRHYHFHNGHTWARIESGGYMRVGLDDFSLKVFGQADGFELAPYGKGNEP
jgi:hypothetical protein